MRIGAKAPGGYKVPIRAADAKPDHPRREQVNQRLKNQHNRVKAGVKDGDLTKQQAHQINKEDRRIRKEEQHMAAKDGGHITKADQAKLNRQENRVRNQINRDEAKNKAVAPTAVPAAPAPAPVAPTPAPAGQ